MGLQAEIQAGQVHNDADFRTGLVPYSGEIENIYAVLEGSDKANHAVLMMAHYDSTLTGPGAADDASGVAALLETARVLLSGETLRNDVILLFTNGEEAELLGSQFFVDHTDLLNNIGIVINFEAMGNKGPSILFETSDKNEWLMKGFKTAVPYPVAYSFTNDIYKITSNITDFMPFKKAGKSGLNFSILGGTETYHNPLDTPENLNQSSLQHQGSYALSLAKHFGNIQMDNVKSGNNVTYFTLMKSVMVFYSMKWILPFAILALILFFLVSYFGFRKRFLQIKGVVNGFLVSILMLLITTGIGITLQTIFLKLYFRIDRIQSTSDLISTRRNVFLNGDKWIPVSMILSILIIFVMQRLFRRIITTYHLFYGNMILWLLITILSSIYLQGSSYIFLWPMIFSLAGLLIEHFIDWVNGPKYLILFIMCTISCVLIYIPIGYALFEALSMTASGISITLLSLPASLIIMAASLLIDKSKKGMVK